MCSTRYCGCEAVQSSSNQRVTGSIPDPAVNMLMYPRARHFLHYMTFTQSDLLTLNTVGNPHRSDLGWSVLPRDTTACWLQGELNQCSEDQRTKPLSHIHPIPELLLMAWPTLVSFLEQLAPYMLVPASVWMCVNGWRLFMLKRFKES